MPAYEQFMKQNQIAVTGEPAAIRRAILDGELPEDVKAEVTAFYRSMGGNVRIAVRSSATAEDLADASFAGQQETYLNIRGGRTGFSTALRHAMPPCGETAPSATGGKRTMTDSMSLWQLCFSAWWRAKLRVCCLPRTRC